MSFVNAAPAMVAAAAHDLAKVGSNIGEANSLAAAPTTSSLAAGADQVSAAVSAFYTNHAEQYQAFSSQMASFHDQFVKALYGGAASYGDAEATNAALVGVKSLLGG